MQHTACSDADIYCIVIHTEYVANEVNDAHYYSTGIGVDDTFCNPAYF